MRHAIMIDFGSTYTKIVVVDLKERCVILFDQFPSTVHTDARIGLENCFCAARRVLSEEEFTGALKLSSSSAAGGLRMAVVGLTRSLSVTAGRDAVFGAGAKVMCTSYGCLTDDQITELENLDLEIILLCGGYENGNITYVMHNAEKIANSSIQVPVVYSGNRLAAKNVRLHMCSNEKECFVIDNIIPEIGVLNIEPSQKIIRDLFMQRITNMKGLSGVKESLGEILMPTPAAVLRAGELLSRGTGTQPGLGAMMMVDIGGATTDIYSYNVNKGYDGAVLVGIEEPYAKRTVEGDMGMRESSICVMNEVGVAGLASEAGIAECDVAPSIDLRVDQTSYIPDTDKQKRLDHAIAKQACAIATRRHAGKLEYIYSGNCERIQRGKNLTEIETVIGTGGPVINSFDPASILKGAELREGDRDILLPRDVETFVDSNYVLYAAGLLRDHDEEAAMAIMKDSIKEI